MPRRKSSKSKEDRLPPFAAILKHMLQSKAWENLSNPARVAYVHMKGKLCNAHQTEVTLSYREMEKFMHQNTFTRAIKQLVENGFIEIEQKGGLYRKRNYYTLIEGWRQII